MDRTNPSTARAAIAWHGYGRFFIIPLVLIFLFTAAAPADAQSRVVVRTKDGVNGLLTITTACLLNKCTVQYALDGSQQKVFLVTSNSLLSTLGLNTLISGLLKTTGIQDAEPDQIVRTKGGPKGGTAPPSAPLALSDKTPVSYYGSTVWRGYLNQPAITIVGASVARNQLAVNGSGVTVAVIDTGVDPTHPALESVLTDSYDFTRNRTGGSEMSDVSQSTMALVDQAKPVFVNQSTMAVVDQSTMALVDDSQHAAFGHGTMVAGIVHLVAPSARIMSLKAFKADGSGYSSDILRALYHAAHNGANVVNMSFSYTSTSRELARTMAYVTDRGIVAVASAGNDGKKIVTYPAALPDVIGVASTTDDDTLSLFSNYGTGVAYLAAPGEAVVTPYPFGTYAAAWGTSFSTPFVAGAAALALQAKSGQTLSQARTALGEAFWVSPEVLKGRLDIPAAVQKVRAQ